MSVWLGVLIGIGALMVVPLLIKYGAKILLTLIIAAGIGAFLGWLLDLAFGTFPTLSIGGAVVATIGLVGASLELFNNSLEE